MTSPASPAGRDYGRDRGPLDRELRALRDRARQVPADWPDYEPPPVQLLPWCSLLTKGGNTVVSTPAEVYGIKRYAGETKATTWKFINRRATATAALTDGSISALTLTDCGLGYAPTPASPPTVTVSAPPSGGTQAVVTATVNADGDRVEGAYPTDCGSGYTYASVVFDDPPTGGVTATGLCVLRDGKVVAITITNKGRGYDEDPVATITGDGSDAAATAVRGKNTITLAVTNAGADYTSITITVAAPPIGVTPAPPSVADATPDDWDDGLGWGTINGGSLAGTLTAGAAVLICHDDRGMVAYGLMGDGAGSAPYSRAPDSILTWYQTLIKLVDADPDADGVLSAWVPMSGGL